MVGAPSVVTEVGWGLWLPRFHLCSSHSRLQYPPQPKMSQARCLSFAIPLHHQPYSLRRRLDLPQGCRYLSVPPSLPRSAPAGVVAVSPPGRLGLQELAAPQAPHDLVSYARLNGRAGQKKERPQTRRWSDTICTAFGRGPGACRSRDE